MSDESADGISPEAAKVVRHLSMASARYLYDEYVGGDRALVRAVLTRLRIVMDEWESKGLTFDPITLQILLDSLLKQFAGAHLALRGVVNTRFSPSEGESEHESDSI